jgi:hypothetical protein
MQPEPNAKQQIVERIKSSTNILVTVGNNPSVDALSAALSLTMMLGRLDKHATAVFSGAVPPAINFLEPGKTFENTVDSLRDFIIALDKEKADRLRYKVEDEVVRIFITPYKTILSENDLKFSQGDFNVELIIALGVEKREDLDTAITAHGRILHDATVVTINADGGQSTLGSIDWSDASASSLCEMLMSLSEALQSGLLDQQIATAVLTGIVASTDRFRNERTSPRVMTMAAQLMAAGANQQLIAAKLEEGHALPDQPAGPPSADGTTKLQEGRSQKVATPEKAPSKDGALEISHTPPPPNAVPPVEPGSEALAEAENELAQSLEKTTAAPATPTLSVNDLRKDLEAAADEVDTAAGTTPTSPNPQSPQIIKKDHRSWRSEPVGEPSFGGTLNATASDAEAAKREEELSHTNRQLLNHDTPVSADIDDGPMPPELPEPPTATPPPPLPTFEPVPQQQPELEVPKPIESTSDDALSFEPTPVGPSSTLADIESQTRGKAAEDARAAIDAALGAMPFDPSNKPTVGAGAVPALEFTHDTPSEPAASVIPDATPPADPPTQQPSVLPMPPPLPPLPDLSSLDDTPAPQAPSQQVPPLSPAPNSAAQPEQIQTPADPAQFKIPGQS